MQVRKILKRGAVATASLLGFLVLAEIIARAAEPGPFTLYDSYPYEKDERYQHSVHQRGFRGFFDGSWYEINSRGMRGPELEPWASEYRVLCLGDSCNGDRPGRVRREGGN